MIVIAGGSGAIAAETVSTRSNVGAAAIFLSPTRPRCAGRKAVMTPGERAAPGKSMQGARLAHAAEGRNRI
jgi:hypothetical protein